MLIEIKHRWTGAVLFTGDYVDIRAALVDASQRSADLSGADLQGADLQGANLSGANLRGAIGINKYLATNLLMLLDQPGKIRLYKLVTAELYSPIHQTILKYEIGSTVEVKDANTDPMELCAAGINVADLPWVMKEWRTGDRILVVEFVAKDIACIPTATNGKLRLHRCTVVGEKDLVELGLVASENKK